MNLRYTKGTEFLQVPIAVLLNDQGLSKLQHHLLIYIISWCLQGEGKAIIQSKHLEEILSVDRKTIYRNVKFLEKEGLISSSYVKTNYSNALCTQYTLNIENINKKYGNILSFSKDSTIYNKNTVADSPRNIKYEHRVPTKAILPQ